ncbi:MAG TPA: hypothetical protein VGN01_16935 [Acidobacteriaceae bacterium]|jgi:hypothetical protein
MQTSPQLRTIRIWLSIFILGLVLSGVTAFPLEHETGWLSGWLNAHPILPQAIIPWINRVHQALHDDSIRAPFLAYGTDWLAFAHLVLAVLFLGPLIDPVRNKWVLQFGLIACAGVLPLALIAGPFRGIPFPWRLIDCSFGVIGAIPLLIALRNTAQLEAGVTG